MAPETETPLVSDRAELEITDAALRAYARLLPGMCRTITTHAASDGGLICEDRATPARPTAWRISAQGDVLPDSCYSFRSTAFVSRLPLAALNGAPAT